MTTLRLTGLVGLPVLDAHGARVGRLSDLAAHLDEPVPVVTRLRYRPGRVGRQHDVPLSAVASVDASQIRLRIPADELRDGCPEATVRIGEGPGPDVE